MESCAEELESRTGSDRDESFRKIEFLEQKVDTEQTIKKENPKSSKTSKSRLKGIPAPTFSAVIMS
jgi:hypothetical protein